MQAKKVENKNKPSKKHERPRVTKVRIISKTRAGKLHLALLRRHHMEERRCKQENAQATAISHDFPTFQAHGFTTLLRIRLPSPKVSESLLSLTGSGETPIPVSHNDVHEAVILRHDNRRNIYN